MQWLKRVIFLSLLLTQAPAAQPSKASSKRTVQEQLVNIATNMQNFETQLSTVEQDLNRAREDEDAILNGINHYNQRLLETIHYLRHATHYSPLLAMLSASKPQDVIHSSMLLRAITPELHARNQQLLQNVKTLSQIRSELEEKQAQLHNITFQYHQEREKLDLLIKERPKNNASFNVGSENNNILSLIPPVAGKLIPTYKNLEPEWASYTQGVLFSTRSGAQVVSPLSGTIAFAGEYAKNQGNMIIIDTPHAHIVMSGLGTLNCSTGQNVMAGEPIGRMPIVHQKKDKGKSLSLPKLYLETWCQEQTVDPQTILRM
ncbi:MAG: hypothetical protein FJX71_03975 [Alphaproteobacteria bacterium]|nr:hypothetical protein [Alphaproteobacteria bacterium]